MRKYLKTQGQGHSSKSLIGVLQIESRSNSKRLKRNDLIVDKVDGDLID